MRRLFARAVAEQRELLAHAGDEAALAELARVRVPRLARPRPPRPDKGDKARFSHVRRVPPVEAALAAASRARATTRTTGAAGQSVAAPVRARAARTYGARRPRSRDFATVDSRRATSARDSVPLGWDWPRGRVLRRYLGVFAWWREHLLAARYANVPLGNLGADAALSSADALFARLLRQPARALGERQRAPRPRAAPSTTRTARGPRSSSGRRSRRRARTAPSASSSSSTGSR